MARIEIIGGADSVLKNLIREDRRVRGQMMRGLKKAGLTLQRESQRLVPVDTGNLKASAFVREDGDSVVVGYTASYALYVHEAVGMVLRGVPRSHGKGRYWDPQGRAQAKFLEEPARRLKPQLMEMIRKEID
jgi:hypothetical protein